MKKAFLAVIVLTTILVAILSLSLVTTAKADGVLTPTATPTATPKTDQSTPYRVWFESRPELVLAAKTGLIDKEWWLTWTPRVIVGVILFFLIFLFLLVQRFVEKSTQKYEKVWAGRLYYWREKPKKYFNGWYWLFLAVDLFVLIKTSDPLLSQFGWEMWRMTFLIAIFFFVASRLDRQRIKGDKGRNPILEAVWSWGVGAIVLYLAALAWGTCVGIMFYTLKARPVGVATQSVAFSTPKKWTGAPLANLPNGYVIPAIWDEIALGVADEGGPASAVSILYPVQRTEFANKGTCTEADHLACTSSAGAQGWFQFMPGTWATYAEPGWDKYNLRDSARAAYRMFKALKLFEQTSRTAFQTRFTGEDGGLAWNQKTANPNDYDGWGQAGIVWDNSQAIIAAAAPKSETVLQPNTVGNAVSISLSEVPPSQQRNVKIWAERNVRVVIPTSTSDVVGRWSFCQATDNTGWDGYDYAGGISAGGICANTSMLYTWVQNTPGLEIEVSTNHTPYAAWPVFTKAVNCPGMDFVIVNKTNLDIVGQWSIDGDVVTLRQVTK